MYPITTHTGKFFASFFQKRREIILLKLTNYTHHERKRKWKTRT